MSDLGISTAPKINLNANQTNNDEEGGLTERQDQND